MTANNHTTFGTHTPANAANIEAPLGQLDAAIGAPVATLATTAKTLVGSNNGIMANIGGLPGLLTNYKVDLAGAINELVGLISGYSAETIILMGDSITVLNDSGPGTLDDLANFHQTARGFWVWANYYLGQRFWMV